MTIKLTPDSESLVAEQTLNWVKSFVIEHNLCPFAKGAVAKNALRIKVTTTKKMAVALEELMAEIVLLDKTPIIETTLLVFENSFRDFFAYLDFIDLAERLMEEQGYQGIYQLATFHPDYYFADTDPDDVSNFTNRSPYPMLHLLKEESLEKAIAAYGDTNKIPERNIACMQKLGIEKIKRLLSAC